MRAIIALCATLLIGAAPAKSLPPRLAAFLLKHHDEDPKARFAVAFVDLNGDGRQEAIVRILLSDWCGSGGCVMLVLTPQGDSYREISHSTIVNAPIRVLATRSHGWRDIGVQVHGGGIVTPYTAALRFDGKLYPLNPSVPPAVRLVRPSGTIVIGANDEGIPLTRQ